MIFLIDIGGGIEEGIRRFFYMLATLIYGLIIDLYGLFEKLCDYTLLDNGTIKSLSNRIGVVLGIVMLFIVTISTIQMLLEPEKMSDKEKGFGNIIKKILIVIIMLGTSSFAFNTLHKVQSVVIKSDAITKILIPYHFTEGTETQFGGILSSELFGAFYRLNPSIETEDTVRYDIIDESNDGETLEECKEDLIKLKQNIREKGNFELGKEWLQHEVEITQKLGSKTEDITEYLVTFNWLLIVLVGIAAIYFLFSYCISVGVRTIQLAFLEIISPMAIVSYLSPKKDTMFEKWWKIYFATFIDVFIRVIIINFIVYLIALIFEDGNLWNKDSGILFGIIMIMALFTFAKKAPDLINKIFPKGDSGIGLGLKNEFGMAGLGLGVGAIGGAIGGAMAGGTLGRRITGAATGLLRGGTAGMSAKKPLDLTKSAKTGYSKSNAAIMRNEQRIAAGGSRYPWMRIGVQSQAAKFDSDLEKLNNISKIKDNIEAAAANDSNVKKLKRKYEQIQNAGRNKIFDSNGNCIGEESAEAYNTRIEAARSAWKDASSAFISASMQGEKEYIDPSTGSKISVNETIATTIQKQTKQLNNELKSNSTLFSKDKYKEVTNYSTLDENSIAALNDSAQMQANDKYIRVKADKKYSGKN